MKTSLIVFGVVFLAIGILLYIVPVQSIKADTTVNGGNTTSSAVVTVPVGWAYTSAAIGGLLLIFGLIAPSPVKIVQGPRGPRGITRYRRRSKPRRSRRASLRRASLPRGTSVTTTTRIRR